VARHQGVAAHAPLVVEHGEIAVAEAAVQHLQDQLISGRLEHRALGALQGATRFPGLPDNDRHNETAQGPRSSQRLRVRRWGRRLTAEHLSPVACSHHAQIVGHRRRGCDVACQRHNPARLGGATVETWGMLAAVAPSPMPPSHVSLASAW
jgi:hypothetical protein